MAREGKVAWQQWWAIVVCTFACLCRVDGRALPWFVAQLCARSVVAQLWALWLWLGGCLCRLWAQPVVAQLWSGLW